uniref:Nuclear pore complex protein Nup85 n=1 Tax=Gongylonema pulchrum TaxID=637853 RepID=A0A183EAA6_9BILA
LAKEGTCAESSSLDLAEELTAAMLGAPHGQETVFIYACVQYLKCVGKIERLLEALLECCQKTPYMFVECYRALLMHDLTDEARRLLESVLPHSSIVSHPVVLDWLQPRLLNPEDYDLPEEMMQNMCKMLFNFLDYGSNKSDERAWAFIWTVIQHVQDEDFLQMLWNPRRSWWPEFHRTELSASAADCRNRVFEKLQSLCGI